MAAACAFVGTTISFFAKEEIELSDRPRSGNEAVENIDESVFRVAVGAGGGFGGNVAVIRHCNSLCGCTLWMRTARTLVRNGSDKADTKAGRRSMLTRDRSTVYLSIAVIVGGALLYTLRFFVKRSMYKKYKNRLAPSCH